MRDKDKIVIGTRGSELALWQTNWVKERLTKHFPETVFIVRKVKTTGDKILDVPLAKIGDKGLFTKELDRALLSGSIDLAVHSLKDLPTALPNGLTIAAITERWDARDALISRKGLRLEDLPDRARVATGSLRRKAQLLHYRPDFQIIDMRGNLNTRFRKFEEEGFDAMILAVAGIERLGWGARICEKISYDVMLPAVGQGSFAVLCREDDVETHSFLRTINDPYADSAARAERKFLKVLEGGCQIPIGAYAEVNDDSLTIEGCVGSLDGRELFRTSREGNLSDAENIGLGLAHRLLEMGAGSILEEINQNQRA